MFLVQYNLHPMRQQEEVGGETGGWGPGEKEQEAGEEKEGSGNPTKVAGTGRK